MQIDLDALPDNPAILQRMLADRAALLLVGDVDQLPSVGPGQVLADVIDSGPMPACSGRG